jgi:purine-binding chemotaxis protein CheW
MHGQSNEKQEVESTIEERFLQFDLGAECYAIDLLSVKEVIPVPETTPLPNSPSHYIGIMNLRGLIISIVDLRKKLAITPKEEEREEAVIIIDIDNVAIGIVVDSINRVLNIPLSQVVEVPEVKSQVNAQYIKGVYQGDQNLTVLLDMKKILNIEEILKQQKAA